MLVAFFIHPLTILFDDLLVLQGDQIWNFSHSLNCFCLLEVSLSHLRFKQPPHFHLKTFVLIDDCFKTFKTRSLFNTVSILDHRRVKHRNLVLAFFHLKVDFIQLQPLLLRKTLKLQDYLGPMFVLSAKFLEFILPCLMLKQILLVLSFQIPCVLCHVLKQLLLQFLCFLAFLALMQVLLNYTAYLVELILHEHDLLFKYVILVLMIIQFSV